MPNVKSIDVPTSLVQNRDDPWTNVVIRETRGP
jgi:hypothetical protein